MSEEQDEPKFVEYENEDQENQEPEEEKKIDEIDLVKLLLKAKDAEKQNKYNEAADFYSEICQARSKIYGEDSYEFADIILLYGEALLKHSQSKEVILAKFNKAIEKKMKVEENDPIEDVVEDDEEEVMDIIIGSFETAKKIYLNCYEKKLFPLDDKFLCTKISRVHKNIAEFHFEGDNFMEGIEEYQKALKFAVDENDKADIHMQISFAYMNLARVEHGVTEYENAMDALLKKESRLSEELKETKEIIVDLKERIDELKQDLKEQEKVKKEEEEKQKIVQQQQNSGKVHMLVPRKKEPEKRKLEGGEDPSEKKVKKDE